ncbi:MAG: hypothetical protein RL131_535 [Bacteroidota bacterium]
MRIPLLIIPVYLLLSVWLQQLNAQPKPSSRELAFLGRSIWVDAPNMQLSYKKFSNQELNNIEKEFNTGFAQSTISSIDSLKQTLKLCDWLTYQLIRKVAQLHIAKQDNYWGYTFAKFYLLQSMGYEPILSIGSNSILLYVRSIDTVYNVPIKLYNGKQYVCLNFHDYNFDSTITANNSVYAKDVIDNPILFSFQIESIPDLSELAYTQRKLNFEFGGKNQQVEIQINEDVKNLFINYPVTNYINQFNIPMSRETKASLINSLKYKVEKMKTKRGVAFLMTFSRNAFGFSSDTELFGREKRLSPEETLIYDKSDCEDRSALFFNLVKEIYNLPMIVLSSDKHVTVAVKLPKMVGEGIEFNGQKFTLCEPTPQGKNLRLGKSVLDPQLKPYEVVYSYFPHSR